MMTTTKIFKIPYYKWLAQFRKDYNAIGDLARDAVKDRKFPRKSNDRQKIHDYLLYDCEASQEAIDTFEKSWELYSKK